MLLLLALLSSSLPICCLLASGNCLGGYGGGASRASQTKVGPVGVTDAPIGVPQEGVEYHSREVLKPLLCIAPVDLMNFRGRKFVPQRLTQQIEVHPDSFNSGFENLEVRSGSVRPSTRCHAL